MRICSSCASELILELLHSARINLKTRLRDAMRRLATATRRCSHFCSTTVMRLLSVSTTLFMLFQLNAGISSSSSLLRTPKTLSVVIPATYEDFTCFSKQLFERVSTSTVKPDEIVLVVSGVQFETNRQNVRVSHLIRVPSILEIIYERRNQAWNKNLGVKLATSDLIMFFDIDDVLYPWAFAAVKHAYASQLNEPVGIMFSHGHLSDDYIRYMRRRQRIPRCTIENVWQCLKLNLYKQYTPFCKVVDTSDKMYRSFRLYNDCFAEHVEALGEEHVSWRCISSGRPMFAAGWFTVTRKHALRFPFDIDFNVAEDGHLIGTLLAYKEDVLFIDIPIAFYNRQHDTPECFVKHQMLDVTLISPIKSQQV